MATTAPSQSNWTHRAQFALLALLSLALMLGVLAPVSASANTSTTAPVTHEIRSAAPSASTVSTPVSVGMSNATPTRALPAAWSDCRKAAAGVPHPVAKIFKALSVTRCAGTVIGAVGRVNADFICWGSRQWWGGPFRWVVSMITSGKYTRC